jgi:riboflavin biosynthesis pyrimidine reductase
MIWYGEKAGSDVEGVCHGKESYMRMEPITTLYEREPVSHRTLPDVLATLYGGGLSIPQERADGLPYLIANFVETVDGVVSYNVDGQTGGGVISGNNAQDQMVMGLLRAYADAVIVGTGSLRQDANHLHTPAGIFPAFAREYGELRARLRKAEREPMSVVVTASGQINLEDATFHTPGLQALIITTAQGSLSLARQTIPQGTEVRIMGAAQGGVDLREALALLAREYGVRLALYEGGPTALASLIAADLLNELFLTLSPQIAGRSSDVSRLALVEGRAFEPAQARWLTLLSAKLADNHLLLRYLLHTEKDHTESTGKKLS